MTRRVALFGGSFNPPHIAHAMVSLYVVETQPVDELWVVPAFRHPFQKELVPFEHRFAMCERAFSVLGDRVTVSDIERELDRDASRTLDTIGALYERHDELALRLVVGSDILAETHKWYRWEEVARLAPPIVIGRAGYAADEDPHAIALPDVSSTEVRARLARGETAVPLVSRAVMDYIAEQELYR